MQVCWTRTESVDQQYPVRRRARDYLASLAAAYGYGIAKNHAFVDGNKRAAFLAIGVFLAVNRRRLEAGQVDAIQTMLALAAGKLDEPQLADWIRAQSRGRDRRGARWNAGPVCGTAAATLPRR